jgi:phosphatidate phosphatase APP1
MVKLVAALLVSGVLAFPADQTQVPAAAAALITPAPTPVLLGGDPGIAKRDVVDSLTSEVAGYVNSIFSELGTALPSYVTEGLLANLEGLPTGSNVLSSANVSSSDLDAIPTSVLNLPGYGNWTGSEWNLRFHGNVYKQPNLSNETVDKLADVFLIDTSVANLSSSEAAQARNVTREIFVVQQGDVNVTMSLEPAPQAGGDGESDGGGGQTPAGGQQTLQLPYETTPEGDFDVFLPLQNSSSGLEPGDGNRVPQRLNVYANGTDTGNATSYLVSEEGLTVISDIDDILRVTRIYQPKDGLLNTFAKPFTPWLNMPSIYANWSKSIPTMHFHYLTTTPEQISRNYEQFIFDNYPGGSFDDRPLNFSDLSATLSIRKFLLDKIFQTFPKRKFILVADTSNSDVMRDYPEMATQYPGQVQCIFLRNTSATDSGDKFPYKTDGFKDVDNSTYMFFLTPDDLMGLDIEGGQCRNMSIQQNVTFDYQGLPFGLSDDAGRHGAPYLFSVVIAAAVSLALNVLDVL